MPRTLATASLGLALFTLTACQQGGHHTGGVRPAPDLAGAFTRTYGAQVADAFPADQRAGIAHCIGQAMASGIPLNDQFLIYDQIDTGQTTAASKAALQRWVGGTVVHGPMQGGFSNKSRYADGTTMTGDPAAERIEGNIQQFCGPYRDRLKRAGYIGVVSGSTPGGFSTGK